MWSIGKRVGKALGHASQLCPHSTTHLWTKCIFPLCRYPPAHNIKASTCFCSAPLLHLPAPITPPAPCPICSHPMPFSARRLTVRTTAPAWKYGVSAPLSMSPPTPPSAPQLPAEWSQTCMGSTPISCAGLVHTVHLRASCLGCSWETTWIGVGASISYAGIQHQGLPLHTGHVTWLCQTDAGATGASRWCIPNPTTCTVHSYHAPCACKEGE